MLHSIRCLAFVLVCAASAFPANTVFSNRTDFLTAVGATTLIDFAGIAPVGGLTGFNIAAGLTLSSVNFTGPTGGAVTPFVLSVVDPGFFPAYNRGGLPASLVGPLNPTHGTDPTIHIVAPAGNPFYAIGFDLYSVQQGDTFPYSATDTPVIQVNGNNYNVPTVAINVGNGLVFFGLLSTDPITSFDIDTTSVLNANTSIGRFAFSTEAPISDGEVPEPATLTIVAAALTAISVWKGRSAIK